MNLWNGKLPWILKVNTARNHTRCEIIVPLWMKESIEPRNTNESLNEKHLEK